MSNFKFVLRLDLSQFSEGMKTAGKLATIGSKQIQQILSGLKADVDEKAFDAELANLQKKISKFEKEPIDIPVEIQTEQADNAISKIQKKMKQDKSIVGKMKESAQSWGLALQGVATIYRTISRVIGEVINKAEMQEKAEMKVEQAVRSTAQTAGFSADELKRMANELQNTTIFGDEDILNNVTAQLLTFTNITEEQFERTQKAAMDLASV